MPVSQVLGRGAISTADRTSNVHPGSWKPQITEQVPVGDAPLTAMLLALDEEPVPSKVHNWFDMAYGQQFGNVADVYTDVALSSAYTTGGVDGTQLYLKLTATDAKRLVAGDFLAIMDTTPSIRRVFVTDVKVAGDTTSYAEVTLRETDTSNVLAGATLYYTIIGHAEAEGSPLPDATFEDVVQYTNYAQIFMESVEFTGTELAELERTSPKQYTLAVARAYMRYRMKMENDILFGKQKVTTGTNGKPLLFMDGLHTVLSSAESNNVSHFPTAYSGYTWLSKGKLWLDTLFELCSRYQSKDGAPAGAPKKLFVGGQAALSIDQLIEDLGLFTYTDGIDEYGVHVRRISAGGTTVDIVRYAPFTINTPLRRCGFVVAPGDIKLKPMQSRATKFVGSKDVNSVENGWTWVDGQKEGWYGQYTMEYHNLAGMLWLTGIGTNG